ncbi:MAG: DUF4037 domain-containing protein [Chloroflexi bacterium]|nr:DUF4037 domain-containing protein [Chloroflexota bacterium]
MLPEQATPASRIRFDFARRFAEACPPDLAEEIAVSGSVARGWSDDDSDVELNLWTSNLPSAEARAAWMAGLGIIALDIEPEARDDDSWWIGGEFQGIPVEFGWQTYEALDRTCERLLSGTVTDRGFTFLADLLLHVISLRETGALAERQARMRDMPERVQRALTTAALTGFKPGHLDSLRRLALRGETLALDAALLSDLDAALRLIYAAHKRWMPSRKWSQTAALEFAPADWLTRFDAALRPIDPLERIEAVRRLVRDALYAIPCYIDVGAALAAWEG